MTANRQINIVIIDDGVNKNDFNLSGNWAIGKDLEITDNLHIQTDNPESHGNICVKIIYKYLKKELIDDICLHSITVLDADMRGNIEQLALAFELCLKFDVKVIHMSIGSSYYKDFPIIQKYVEALFERGVIKVVPCKA